MRCLIMPAGTEYRTDSRQDFTRNAGLVTGHGIPRGTCEHSIRIFQLMADRYMVLHCLTLISIKTWCQKCGAVRQQGDLACLALPAADRHLYLFTLKDLRVKRDCPPSSTPSSVQGGAVALWLCDDDFLGNSYVK